MIDSELVPWGKGEKHPGEGGEIVPETIYLQRVGAPLQFYDKFVKLERGDSVPIEEWANEFVLCGLTNPRLGWSQSESEP